MKQNNTGLPLFNIREEVEYMGYKWEAEDYFIGMDHISSEPQFKEPHVINFYMLIVQIQGWVELRIDDELIRLEENSFFALSPGHVCQYICQSEDSKEQIVFFTKNFLFSTFDNNHHYEELFHYFSKHLSHHHKLSDNDVKEISYLYNALLNKRKDKATKLNVELIRMLISTYILEFSNLCIKEASKTLNTRSTELVNGFKKLVFHNCLKEKNMQFYADALYVSSKYLHNVIKTTTGQPPKYFIDSAIISLAKYQLKNTSLTISEVAGTFPFSDLHSFSKFFKKHTGVSPFEYRTNRS